MQRTRIQVRTTKQLPGIFLAAEILRGSRGRESTNGDPPFQVQPTQIVPGSQYTNIHNIQCSATVFPWPIIITCRTNERKNQPADLFAPCTYARVAFPTTGSDKASCGHHPRNVLGPANFH